MNITNILNGDSAVGFFQASGFPGEIRVWREVYTEGPLEHSNDLPKFQRIRARYLSGIVQEWNEDQIRHGLERMDAAVAAPGPDGILRIWADACMFDQAMIARILYVAAVIPVAERPAVELYADDVICPAPDAFPRLAEACARLTPSDVAAGAEIWLAFTRFETPDRVKIPPVFRFMREALTRHAAEHPADGGPGLTLRRILTLASDGAGITPLELFHKLSALEHYPWFGDTGLWRMVDSLTKTGKLRVTRPDGTPEPCLAFLSSEKIEKCRIFSVSASA